MLVKLMCMHCQSEIIKIDCETRILQRNATTFLIILGHSLNPGSLQMPTCISRLVQSKFISIDKIILVRIIK